MVENPRTSAGTGGLRLLNQPKPTAVEATPGGEPKAIIIQGRFQGVRAILDSWRIDDEWWRDEISRRYFTVELANGRKLTVCNDLITGGWFSQGYGTPGTGKTLTARKP